jgi:hypothetical protein
MNMEHNFRERKESRMPQEQTVFIYQLTVNCFGYVVCNGGMNSDELGHISALKIFQMVQ